MTPADLRSAGEFLFGTRWRTALARDIGTTYRTVKRWEMGERKIPLWAAISIGKSMQIIDSIRL